MFFKEPTEVLTYSIDWSDWLNGLTISTSVWSVPVGITKDNDDSNSNTTFITLSGGTWGETYELTNTITAGAETETRTLLVRIQRSVAYCTPLEVRRRAAKGSATENSLPTAELEALIEQASRIFDLACGVPEGYFNPVAIPVAQTRTIYGDGSNYLRLPPYVAGSLSSTIALPEGYTAPTFTESNNYLIINSNGFLPPFRYFNNLLWQGWYSGVPLTVTAIWGWRETPADVKAAIIEFVLNLRSEVDPQQVKLTNIEGQPLRERMPPRVWDIARRYQAQQGVLV